MPRASRKASRKRRPAPPGLSLRAFARRLGVDEKAVRKGIQSGRLSRSVGLVKGRPRVLDADLGAKEWAAGASKPGPAATGPTAEPPKGPSLLAVQVRVAQEKATALRLSNRQRAGRLIHAEVARREAFESARAIRDAVLGVPDRVAAELAACSDTQRVHARLVAELREALSTAAQLLAHAG